MEQLTSTASAQLFVSLCLLLMITKLHDRHINLPPKVCDPCETMSLGSCVHAPHIIVDSHIDNPPLSSLYLKPVDYAGILKARALIS